MIDSLPGVKTVAEAKVIQEQLRHQVITADDLGVVKYVAGVDIGFEKNYEKNMQSQKQRSLF